MKFVNKKKGVGVLILPRYGKRKNPWLPERDQHGAAVLHPPQPHSPGGAAQCMLHVAQGAEEVDGRPESRGSD